ncbi:MAG: bifunctional nuclease family protein [Chloroflexi bacterium]|nr:bifunctional nuclease family protein [Chloroflexota bacterium]
MKEMQIDSIRVSLMNYQHVVILKERQTDRYLPIWIGPAEADAISMKLQNVDVSRPMTHDLLKNTLFALESLSGTNISKIVVNDLRSDTFYAQIVFEFNDGPPVIDMEAQAGGNRVQDFSADSKLTLVWQGREFKSTIMRRWQDDKKNFMEVDGGEGWAFEVFFDEHNKRWLLTRMKLDSRPSDAIALAVRVTAPIYAEESVLDKAGIILDAESGKITAQPRAGEPGSVPPEKMDEQELKKLSAFYDFINTLNLDDFGKKKS